MSTARQDDDGFTLIELLVVMIIIGILAAIAIPIFLHTQTDSYKAAAVSDMGNVRTAIQTYATDNDGSYSGLDGATQNSSLLQDEGFSSSQWVSLTVTASDDSYCVVAQHTHVPGQQFVVKSATGTIVEQPLSGPGCS
jgi:type IV pilus assembly protein PilA